MASLTSSFTQNTPDKVVFPVTKMFVRVWGKTLVGDNEGGNFA